MSQLIKGGRYRFNGHCSSGAKCEHLADQLTATQAQLEEARQEWSERELRYRQDWRSLRQQLAAREAELEEAHHVAAELAVNAHRLKAELTQMRKNVGAVMRRWVNHPHHIEQEMLALMDEIGAALTPPEPQVKLTPEQWDQFNQILDSPPPVTERFKQAAARYRALGLDQAQEPPLEFTYTNWQGKTAQRKAVPMRVFYGSTEHHPEPQWLMEAFDTDKGAVRVFAIKDMRSITGGEI